MSPVDFKAGNKVELSDKDGGFTDPITGFDLSRSQQKPLTEPVGERTKQALMSGGLLIVSDKGKTKNLGEVAEPEVEPETKTKGKK